MKDVSLLVEVAGHRYVARRHLDSWRLYAVSDDGVRLGAKPSAFALTAGEAWTHGVAAAAELPIDELVIVAADERGNLGQRLISGICPPELLIVDSE